MSESGPSDPSLWKIRTTSCQRPPFRVSELNGHRMCHWLFIGFPINTAISCGYTPFSDIPVWSNGLRTTLSKLLCRIQQKIHHKVLRRSFCFNFGFLPTPSRLYQPIESRSCRSNARKHMHVTFLVRQAPKTAATCWKTSSKPMKNSSPSPQLGSGHCHISDLTGNLTGQIGFSWNGGSPSHHGFQY